MAVTSRRHPLARSLPPSSLLETCDPILSPEQNHSLRAGARRKGSARQTVRLPREGGGGEATRSPRSWCLDGGQQWRGNEAGAGNRASVFERGVTFHPPPPPAAFLLANARPGLAGRSRLL